MGVVDYRVGGRIFATLASGPKGFGNLMLTPEVQAAFVAERPELFLPVAGGWGRMGATHVRLHEVSEAMLLGALRTAWKLRVEKNAKAGRSKTGAGKTGAGKFRAGKTDAGKAPAGKAPAVKSPAKKPRKMPVMPKR